MLQTILTLSQLPWYQDTFFYLFVGIFILFAVVVTIMMKVFAKKSAEMKLMQQQHVAKVDNIRGEQSDVMERIRQEMLKREEERGRQWMESEKETLHVLNGVSALLDLSDKIGRVESDKIISKLEELQQKVEKLTSNE
jgi:hypothetical protein